MACSYLLLELALRPRESEGSPGASTGYRLSAAYAVEMDEQARRHRSYRWTLKDEARPSAEANIEQFDSELSLLARVLTQIEEASCLVTARGRQLEIPVLEALAVRYGLTLRGHFPLEDPYQARRSPYNPAGHLDLSFFLADGERRSRGLGPELLLPLVYPQAPRLPPRDPLHDDLEAARDRALATYLLFLRVQELRGRLSTEEVARRKSELQTGLSPEMAAVARASEERPAVHPAPTWLDQTGEGLLAFDIETALDLEAVSRCAGRPIANGEEALAALGEMLGAPTDFPPAPFHRVVALAMVFWNGSGGSPEPGSEPELEIERLVLGGQSRLGAPLPDESSLLSAFWRNAAGKRLLSYNGKRFDLPVLLYRSLPYPLEAGWYLAEKRPAYEQYRHPQSLRQLDVFEQLSGGLSPGRLGDLLKTVGLPGKQGTAGGDVDELWAAQKLDQIGDYCLSDAAQTFLLALRFMSVSGQIDRSQAGAAIAAARSRFEREPALQRMLEGATKFFESV